MVNFKVKTENYLLNYYDQRQMPFVNNVRLKFIKSMIFLKAAILQNILENQIFQNISLNTYNSC